MDQWIKLVLIQAVLLLCQTAAYFLVQKFEGPAHDMERAADRRIPLMPQAVFVYILWYPLIALFPLYLYSCSPVWYLRYMISIVSDIILSCAVYLLYPTSFQRPKPPENSFSGKALGIMYKADYTGKNCLPSMHCSMCFLVILYCLCCLWSGMMAPGAAAALCILAALIVCATLLTKQHVIIDVAAALPTALVCFFAGWLVSAV